LIGKFSKNLVKDVYLERLVCQPQNQKGLLSNANRKNLMNWLRHFGGIRNRSGMAAAHVDELMMKNETVIQANSKPQNAAELPRDSMVNNCAIDCQTTVSRVKFGSGVEKSDNGNPQMNPSIIFKSDQSRLPAFLKNQFANRVAILGPHDFLESKGLSYQWVGQRRYYANDPLKKEKNRKVYENEYKDKIKAENSNH